MTNGRGRALLAAAAAAAALGGCVERRMLLRSEPQGAMIRLDGKDLEAPTPVEMPATFDGPHRVELVANGYRALDTVAVVPARWYDWFPADFFAEFLYPGTIHEMHVFDFRLEPLVPMTQALTEQDKSELASRLIDVKARADEYRAGGAAGPASPVAPPVPPPAPKRDDTPPPPPPPARSGK